MTDTDTRTTEERLAALEAIVYVPLQPWRGMTGEEVTGEEVAEFEARLRVWAEGKYEPVRLMPPRPLLTPELARALLRECVTISRLRVPSVARSQTARSSSLIPPFFRYRRERAAWATG